MTLFQRVGGTWTERGGCMYRSVIIAGSKGCTEMWVVPPEALCEIWLNSDLGALWETGCPPWKDRLERAHRLVACSTTDGFAASLAAPHSPNRTPISSISSLPSTTTSKGSQPRLGPDAKFSPLRSEPSARWPPLLLLARARWRFGECGCFERERGNRLSRCVVSWKSPGPNRAETPRPR